MPELLSLPFLGDEYVEYDSLIAAYPLGQICRQCKHKIIHHESVSACACHRYSHEKCLIKDVNQLNKAKSELVFKCKTCEKILGVNYNLNVFSRPHINKLNILLVILSLLVLGFALYAAYVFRNDYLRQAFNSVIIAICLTVLTISIVNSIVVKEYTAVSIKSTNLGLMISAFMDLEKQLTDQTTNTQMIRG